MHLMQEKNLNSFFFWKQRSKEETKEANKLKQVKKKTGNDSTEQLLDITKNMFCCSFQKDLEFNYKFTYGFLFVIL